MRILELKLDAFGPFTREAISLASGNRGLHLLYGPNEAGKTSALRAICQLLYGIPAQSNDDFIHKYRDFRLGGTLERGDGERLEFIRLKRNKNPLLMADGITPLDPARLDRFLGSVDQALFSSLFGIDHERLVAGGQEIIEGGGSLGNVLFSAGSGLSSLRGLQKRLQEHSDELFKPGGKVQRIPRAINELREANLRLKGVALSGDEWSRHDLALRSARDQQRALEARRRDKECEVNRLRRIRAAFSLASERAQLLDELSGYRDAVPIAEDFEDRRRRSQGQKAAAALEIQRAGRSLEELTARRGAITLADSLLEASAEVESLRDQQAAQRKALRDREKLLVSLQEKEHDAREILQSLGKPRDVSHAESLRLRVDEPGRIAQLGHQYTELVTRRNETQASVRKHGEKLTKLLKELDSLGIPPDLSRLRSYHQGAQQEGNLEDLLSRQRSQLLPKEIERDALLRRLPGWTASLEALEALALPLSETISRYETDIQDIEASLRELARSLANEEERIRDLEAKLREQSIKAEIPSEDDLRDARQRREDAWSQIRAAWLGLSAVPPVRQPDDEEVESPGPLAEAYEKSVLQADQLADRLRREAQHVAAKAEWQAQLEKHRHSADRLSVQLENAKGRQEEMRSGWEGLLSTPGLRSMSPGELRSWITERDKVLVLQSQARTLQGECERLEGLINWHRGRLSAGLTGLNVEVTDSGGSLASLVEAAGSLIARQDVLARKLDRLHVQVTDEQGSLDSARSELDAIEGELEAWRSQWGGLMPRIGLGPDATHEQASLFLAEITRLFKAIDEARHFQSRIKGIDRDEARFAAEARALAHRVAPEHVNMSPSEIADVLWDRLRAARDDLQLHRALSERIDGEVEALEEAEKAHSDARLDLESLCRDAGVSAEDELPTAERRSARRSQLESDLKRCEGQLRQQSGGVAVEAFAQEVGRTNPDTLDRSIEDVEAELKSIQEELTEVNQSIGSESAQLDRMDGGSRAAEANEAAGFALGQLMEDVPRYAVLRLASRVLQRGVERYRERNQGPLLGRASEIFAALTQGSFAGLRIESDDRDEPVIVGVRPEGHPLNVEAMSLGSCDQLYLAIRIAYLDHWLNGREPMPFIVDDILLQFDNGRAMAALQVLGELSRRTQVIFFTHHAHLLELARSCLPEDVLFPQMIPSGAPL